MQDISQIQWSEEEEKLIMDSFGKLDEVMYLFEQKKDMEKIEVFQPSHNYMQKVVTLISIKHMLEDIEKRKEI